MGLKLDKMQVFTFNPYYNQIFLLTRNTMSDVALMETLTALWQLPVPTKVGVFGWRLLLGRLIIRDVLVVRGILCGPFGCCCPLCFE